MADTRNWKMLGRDIAAGTMTIKANNSSIYSGNIGTAEFNISDHGGRYIDINLETDRLVAEGNLTYTMDTNDANISTPVSMEISVQSGGVTFLDFLWNYAPVINPALTEEEKGVAESGGDAMRAASQTIKDSVLAKGGYFLYDGNLYYQGGTAEDLNARLNVKVNGQSVSPNPMGAIELTAGDTLTFDAMVSKAPTRI